MSNMPHSHLGMPGNSLTSSSLDVKPPLGGAPIGSIPPNPLGMTQHHNLHMDQDMQSLMHQVGLVC